MKKLIILFLFFSFYLYSQYYDFDEEIPLKVKISSYIGASYNMSGVPLSSILGGGIGINYYFIEGELIMWGKNTFNKNIGKVSGAEINGLIVTPHHLRFRGSGGGIALGVGASEKYNNPYFLASILLQGSLNFKLSRRTTFLSLTMRGYFSSYTNHISHFNTRLMWGIGIIF